MLITRRWKQSLNLPRATGVLISLSLSQRMLTPDHPTLVTRC